jgi:hypothetical protein
VARVAALTVTMYNMGVNSSCIHKLLDRAKSMLLNQNQRQVLICLTALALTVLMFLTALALIVLMFLIALALTVLVFLTEIVVTVLMFRTEIGYVVLVSLTEIVLTLLIFLPKIVLAVLVFLRICRPRPKRTPASTKNPASLPTPKWDTT